MEELKNWVPNKIPENIDNKSDKVKLCDVIISSLIKKIREEVSTLSHKPPKESLSYSVYHNKIDDLKSILNLNENEYFEHLEKKYL